MRKIFGVDPLGKNRILGIIGIIYLTALIIKLFINLFF